MFSLTIKGLRAHKLRFVLTGLAVVLGVAFMAGTLVLTDTMGKTFDDLFQTANQGVDAVVQRDAAFTSNHGTERDRISGDVLEKVRATTGVAHAEGSVMGFAQLVGPDGTLVGNPANGAPTLGTNWIADEALNPFRLEAGGRAPRGASEVVIDKQSATKTGLHVGDQVTIITQTAPKPFTISGIATFGGASSMAGASLAAFATATAQALLAAPNTFDAIQVKAAAGVTPGELVAHLDQTVGHASGQPGVEVLSGADEAVNQQKDLQKGLSFFNQFLMTFALVSLFVGTFIIYNTFTILVAQRSREMALLRAIGARRRQVLGSVMIESVAVGLLASLTGLGLGVFMAQGLKALLTFVGLELPSGPTVLAPRTIVVSLVVGLGVTIASAFIPARKASRIPPIAALRDVAIDRTGRGAGRAIIGSVITLGGIGAFATGLSTSSTNALALIGVGAMATVIGVFVLGPVIARPVSSIIGWPLAKTGMTGRLARSNAVRNPRRTSATASALMIGVALVGFITILASSTKASTAAAVDQVMRADYVIESGSFGTGGLPPQIERDLAATPGVETVSPVRLARASMTTGNPSADATVDATTATDATGVEIVAIDPATIDQVFDAKPTAGSLRDLTLNGVAVSQAEADAKQLHLGDQVNATFLRSTSTPLTVQAIFKEQIPGGAKADYVISLPTYATVVVEQFDARVFVKATSDATAEASRSALDATLKSYPNASLQDQAQFKAGLEKEIDMILNLVYGLLFLAIVIALIGIANTLALSVHERRRELGLLRAVGMTRRQVRTSVRGESIIIALLGTALGVLLGVGGAWGVGVALRAQGVTKFVVPAGSMTAIVLLAIGAGVIAAVGPARRAAKLDVLKAISGE